MVEQGALVAEEEVILPSAFCLAVISYYFPVYLIHFLIYSAIPIPPLFPLSQREEKKRDMKTLCVGGGGERNR